LAQETAKPVGQALCLPRRFLHAHEKNYHCSENERKQEIGHKKNTGSAAVPVCGLPQGRLFQPAKIETLIFSFLF